MLNSIGYSRRAQGDLFRTTKDDGPVQRYIFRGYVGFSVMQSGFLSYELESHS